MPMPTTDIEKIKAILDHSTALQNAALGMDRTFNLALTNEAMIKRDMIKEFAERIKELAEALPAYVP